MVSRQELEAMRDGIVNALDGLIDVTNMVFDVWIADSELPNPEPTPEPPPIPSPTLPDPFNDINEAQAQLRLPEKFQFNTFKQAYPDYIVVDLYNYFQTTGKTQYNMTGDDLEKNWVFIASQPLRQQCKVNLYGKSNNPYGHIVFGGIEVDLPGTTASTAKHGIELIDMSFNTVRKKKGNVWDIPTTFKGTVTIKDCYVHGNTRDGIFSGWVHAKHEIIDTRVEDTGKYVTKNQDHCDGFQSTGFKSLYISRCSFVKQTYQMIFLTNDMQYPDTKFNPLGDIYIEDTNFSGSLDHPAGIFLYVHPDNGKVTLRNVWAWANYANGDNRPFNKYVIYKAMYNRTSARNLDMIIKKDVPPRLEFPYISEFDFRVDGSIIIDLPDEDFAPLDRYQ